MNLKGSRMKGYHIVAVAVCLVIIIVYYNLRNAFPASHPQRLKVLDEDDVKVETVNDTNQGKLHHTHREYKDNHLHVVFIFNKVVPHGHLQKMLSLCVSSIVSKASIPVQFHIVGDRLSFQVALDTFDELSLDGIVKLYHHNNTAMEKTAHVWVSPLVKTFSAKRHRFSDPLFYLSTVMHRVMPQAISKLIVLDVDVIFKSDISKLFNLFQNFRNEQVIGIAWDNAPVYRHIFREYRKQHPQTSIGEPPPGGIPGFNSGVLLLHLDKLRQSEKYNSMFAVEVLSSLAAKYQLQFQSHLGDQDFYTLLSFEHLELFYVLPCGWNRQLCTWWKRDELVEVFDRYYHCEGPIHVIHGNCRTSLHNYTTEY